MTVPRARTVVMLVVATTLGTLARLGARYGQYEGLAVARCEARCWHVEDKSACVKSCLVKADDKPGFCPPRNATLSPFAAVCMETCQNDIQCSGVKKCCRHSCGVTCQHPLELNSAVGLPEIPKDIKVSERRRKRTIFIEWTPGESSYLDEGGGVVLYLIEERQYAGEHFIESRMSEWTVCARTIKNSQILRHFGKPGSWYQFRVAAVNEKGTRGYSEYSLPFTVSISPKPPKAPLNMTVGPLVIKNGTISVELRWMAPPSDLPLQRYKVFWSRRLQGANKALDSVLVRHRFVPRDETQDLLEGLLPNLTYFLQVQALAKFGKKLLQSEKSGIVLNTTNYSHGSENAPLSEEAGDGIDGLQLSKLFWSENDLRARFAWTAKRKSMRYTVNWKSGPCHDKSNGLNHFKLEDDTGKPHFDLYNLKFNCRYRLVVREVSSHGVKLSQGTITFTTPKCNTFRANHKKIRCH